MFRLTLLCVLSVISSSAEVPFSQSVVSNEPAKVTVQLEIPLGNSSVTLKATEGDDFVRLGTLFVEKYKDKINGTQITAQNIEKALIKLVADGKSKNTQQEATPVKATAYSASLTVNMGEKGKVQLVFTEGEDLQVKALDFCNKYGLGKEACQNVYSSMRVLMKEARVRGEAEAAAEADLRSILGEEQNLIQFDEHYMGALAALVGLTVCLKLLMSAWQHASVNRKRRSFDNSHKKHAENKSFLQDWANIPKQTKTGKNGNKISHRQQPAPLPTKLTKVKKKN